MSEVQVEAKSFNWMQTDSQQCTASVKLPLNIHGVLADEAFSSLKSARGKYSHLAYISLKDLLKCFP